MRAECAQLLQGRTINSPGQLQQGLWSIRMKMVDTGWGFELGGSLFSRRSADRVAKGGEGGWVELGHLVSEWQESTLRQASMVARRAAATARSSQMRTRTPGRSRSKLESPNRWWPTLCRPLHAATRSWLRPNWWTSSSWHSPTPSPRRERSPSTSLGLSPKSRMAVSFTRITWVANLYNDQPHFRTPDWATFRILQLVLLRCLLNYNNESGDLIVRLNQPSCRSLIDCACTMSRMSCGLYIERYRYRSKHEWRASSLCLEAIATESWGPIWERPETRIDMTDLMWHPLKG